MAADRSDERFGTWLASFRDLAIGVEELSRLARGKLRLRRATAGAVSELSVEWTGPPETAIPVRKEHLIHALETYVLGEITEEHLEEWAEILIALDDCFVLSPPSEHEEELLASVLHRLAEMKIQGGMNTGIARYLLECLRHGDLPGERT